MKRLLTYAVLFCSALGFSQVEKNSELYKTLKAKDSLIFTEGLNKCNIELISSLVEDDLEFYHDIGGVTDNKEDFVSQIKNSPCKNGKVENKRLLVPSSLEVHALYDNGKLYGAIQMGEHKFAETTAKFIHLWILNDGEWKISRVLSYNH